MYTKRLKVLSLGTYELHMPGVPPVGGDGS